MSYNGPKTHAEAQISTQIDCSDSPSLTVQADANEADINKIIKRFEKAGMVTRLSQQPPFYGDVSEFGGLQDAILKVEKADELFMSMSAQIRERFGNNPVEMMDFLMDPNNRPEAESLGMVIIKPVDPAKPATPTPTPAAG